MKKVSEKRKILDQRNSIILRKKGKRRVKKYIPNKFKNRRNQKNNDGITRTNVKKARNRIIKKFFTLTPALDIVVPFEGEIGLEDKEAAIKYFDFAQKITRSDCKSLILDLKYVSRIWPSAIMLFCSLAQWHRIALTHSGKNFKELASTKPDSKDVEDYLIYCGFYKYVGIDDTKKDVQKFNSSIVKLKRETEKDNIEKRADEIYALIERESSLSCDEKEIFLDRVLHEIINNVSEHGITTLDQGWWLMAQHHLQHGFISLCIGDNGIGIKNSLTTGIQRNYINGNVKNDDDAEYMSFAFNEKISGAITASVATNSALKRKKFPKGRTRGNGLMHIRNSCKELSIAWTLLSHKGCIMFDEFGNEERNTYDNKIFSGTLYHLLIKAKK